MPKDREIIVVRPPAQMAILIRNLCHFILQQVKTTHWQQRKATRIKIYVNSRYVLTGPYATVVIRFYPYFVPDGTNQAMYFSSVRNGMSVECNR